MKKLYIFLGILFLNSSQATSQPVLINIGTTTLETSALYTTTDVPWELKYGPGDSLWMTTRNGRVFRIHPGNGGATMLLDHSANVWQVSEAGMLGMEFHPDFAANPYVYIAYTYTNAGLNRERLSRFTYSGNSLGAEFVLIDGGNIAAASIHNGSRLLMLPDQTLLMTTGDAAVTANAQNNSSLNGKILRLNLDGSIPSDNPTPGSYIYTKGHRNPQGLMLHPNGKIYETEHGPNNNDEFQIIEAGRNYGWPNVQGFCDDDIGGESAFCTANNVKEPLASWLVTPGGTWAPNDLVWYSHPSIPEFENSFLVTFLKTAKVRCVKMDASGDAILSQSDFFVNQWGRLRDITTAPNGDIYIATNSSPNRIIRLRNTTTIPVYMEDYRVFCEGDDMTLSWITRAEINNRRFYVYRSIDGVNFTLLQTIESAAPGGTSGIPLRYSYTDDQFAGKRAFYKLESEDMDGRRRAFNILTVSCNADAGSFILTPNPANDMATLVVGGISGKVNIRVSNSLGQQMFIYQSGNESVQLPVQKWGRGVYHIVISNEAKQVLHRQQLVVQ